MYLLTLCVCYYTLINSSIILCSFAKNIEPNLLQENWNAYQELVYKNSINHNVQFSY